MFHKLAPFGRHASGGQTLLQCVRNKAERLESQGFQGQMALFKCKVFGRNCPKTLHFPLVRLTAPAEIRIATMAEFQKAALVRRFYGIARLPPRE
ncbi:MAG TPA: hypothetical protein H9839_04885 [Candidatus Intestinimonas stercorigallinarum]|nr:hypothetical protein [Candidatus Intestinimonas stercorigallinarum]